MKSLLRLMFDIVAMGIVNRQVFLSLLIYFLLLVGTVIAVANVSAPFIYTLF